MFSIIVSIYIYIYSDGSGVDDDDDDGETAAMDAIDGVSRSRSRLLRACVF